MNNNIKEIATKYRWNQDIRQYTNKHYRNDNSFYRTVQSNREVEIALDSIKTHLETVSKMYPLHREDVIDLEKTMAQYETAVNKVVASYEHSINNDYSYTADELQGLIDNIYVFYEKIVEQRSRYGMQDNY